MAAPIITQEMTLYDNGLPLGGFSWLNKFSLGVATTKAILLPKGQRTSVLYSAVGGTVAVYATISSKDDIEAGTAQWVLVTSGTEINPGVTAVYFDNSASTTVVELKVFAIGG